MYITRKNIQFFFLSLLFSCTLTMACGGGDSGGGLGDPCSSNTDCSTGLICNSMGQCITVQCTNNEACPDGQVCSIEFTCVDPGSDGDQVDGDWIPPDGDEPDGDQVDGDGIPSDGDEPDGDVDEDDPDIAGEISGSVFIGADMAEYDAAIQLYDENPFVNLAALPVDWKELPGGVDALERVYAFTGVESGRYYIRVLVNVGNNDDLLDDVFAVHHEVLTLIVEDEALRVKTGVDIYVAGSDPDLASISGKLHLSAVYQDYRKLVLFSEKKVGAADFWPGSITFVEPQAGVGQVDYKCGSLSAGDYFITVYVLVADEVPLVYPSPRATVAVDPDQIGLKDITGQDFYLGLADADFGSIQGTIRLPAPTAGEMGIYVFANIDEGVQTEPQALVMVKNDGTLSNIPYTVGNLVTQEEIWVAGFLRIDEEHITFAYHDPGETALAIDLDNPAKKNLYSKNLDLAITEMTGTLTVSYSTEPALARLVLVELDEGLIDLVPEIVAYGGGVDVELSSSRGSVSGDYVMFPVAGGNKWATFVYLDTDGTEGITPDDVICYQDKPLIGDRPTISVNGAKLNVSNVNIHMNTSSNWSCVDPTQTK